MQQLRRKRNDRRKIKNGDVLMSCSIEEDVKIFNTADEFMENYAKKNKYWFDAKHGYENQIRKNNEKIAMLTNELNEIEKNAPKIQGNLTRRRDISDLKRAEAFTNKYALHYTTNQNIIANLKELNEKIKKEMNNPQSDIKNIVNAQIKKAKEMGTYKNKSELLKIWNNAHEGSNNICHTLDNILKNR